MIIGIDLGTTNSLAAVWRHGAATLIPNSLGQVLTPSAVSIAENGEILVGAAARDRLATHPLRSVASFKRAMGTTKVFDLGKQSFRPEELSAFVLRSLKADAEAFLDEPVREAIITVPAYFNDLQRKATQSAGAIAGLSVLRLLTEPTAAALAYGVLETEREQSILVADIGGGTFDVSLLQSFEGVMEVRATAGDIFLGGEDFVDIIVQAFMDAAGTKAGLPPVSAAAAIHGALRHEAEQAKRTLSDAQEAKLSVVFQGRDVEWVLTRDNFEALAEPVLARIRRPIERALGDARMHPDEISQVILAGGASRMPCFRRLIGRLFRRLPSQSINPDEVVARGAAVRAGMQGREAGLEELVMTDVCPFTLGIDTSTTLPDGNRISGLFSPIIERNTVVPVSRVQRYTTITDNQTKITFGIYQGESRLVKDNLKLGELIVHVPKLPAGEAQVDVRFTHDASGLLEVETIVEQTGATDRLVIEGQAGRLTPKEIEEHLARLAKLKVAPRDEAENVALLARADRLYQQCLGAEREQIGAGITQFMAALASQDAMNIRIASKHLTRLLDARESPGLP
jgi:molecular chaperone HscC